MDIDYAVLKNKKVSVLMDGLNKKESYIGEIEQIFEDTIVLKIIDLTGPKYYKELPMKRIYILKSVIISIWEYKDGK